MNHITFTKPEILTHPHIPKPLHGVNPRTINGKDWWDRIRYKVYAKYDQHCIACGVHKTKAKSHKWLEAHEFWQIDYNTGICKVETIEPLCHYCHNFIHSGRLSMIMGKEKTIKEVKEILKHGLKILKDNNLPCFYWTLDFARKLKINTSGIKSSNRYSKKIPWKDWHLLYNKQKWRSSFKSIEEWNQFYNSI